MTSSGWTLDHVALTVPRLDEAVAFFTEVVGAELAYERTMPVGADPRAMRENFNAHEDAGFRLAKLSLGPVGLELFEYTAPDQRTDQPRNCDVGGGHWGLIVPAIDAAVARAAGHPGVRVLGTVQVLPALHPLAGRRWVYLLTPWGQQVELVSDELRPSAATR